MSDDFLRLVSQANPATRQYQPANTNNGYPPSSSIGPYSDQQSPQPMDPFFDDDDDNMPDSAFGRPAPMQSQESGLPLARSAAPPAGTGNSNLSLGDGVPQGWNFDDDDFQPAGERSFPGSSPYSGPSNPTPPVRKRKWKWPWQKETVLARERIIALNNSAANADFSSNSVSTSKYNLASFIPKFLTGILALFVFIRLLTFQQNNFRNMRTCSSSSLLVYNKFQAFLRQINIPPSLLWL